MHAPRRNRSKRRITALAIIAQFALASGAVASQELEALPEDLEVELARSALPAHLRAEATIHVLRPDEGYVPLIAGSNGFHALVIRNDPAFAQGDWAYAEYRNDLLVPIAFDQAGAAAHMRVHLDVAAARARGIPPEALRDTLRVRYAIGHYGPAERAGVSYMLSPIMRPYIDAETSDAARTMSYPHYMVYAPGVTNEDIGGNPAQGHAFVFEPGVHGFIVIGAGRAERADIVNESAELLDRLCVLSTSWCLGDRGQ